MKEVVVIVNNEDIYCKQYLTLVFYFCLKKTGNIHQSSELASEISYEILKGLKKKTPTHLESWIWQIAKNRYSRWAINKKSKRSNEYSIDYYNIDNITGIENVEEAVIYNEQLILLRRELAFIQSDYRDILVAFYINGRKISDIASELSLPEGTIKTRLFYGKKKLKEGMNMAREYGIRSYHPENIKFLASGKQGKAPWGYVERKICKNILLQAHNNPSTIEELSLELGIASPYMEEEVNLLIEGELLCQVDKNKYLTNFYIASKDVQLTIYKIMHENSKKRCKLLSKIIDDQIDEIRKLNIVDITVTNNEFKWLLYTRITDLINLLIDGYGILNTFKHKDGNNWGFMGYEVSKNIPKSSIISQNGSGNADNTLWIYAYGSYGFEKRIKWIDHTQSTLLSDIVLNKRKAKDLSMSEQNIFKNIKSFLYYVDSDGYILPKFAVFKKTSYEQIIVIVKYHQEFKFLMNMINDMYNAVKATLKTDSIPHLHKYLDYYASMFMYENRDIVISDSILLNNLNLLDDPKNNAAGIYMDTN